MPEITVELAEDQLKKRSKNITEKDLINVLNKRDEIEEKFRTNGPLGKFFNDFKLLFSIIQDYIKGNYRKIPYYSIAAIAAALIYVLTPIDLIPDFIPIIGYIDDAMVVAACLRLIEQDLYEYREWKKQQMLELQ